MQKIIIVLAAFLTQSYCQSPQNLDYVCLPINSGLVPHPTNCNLYIACNQYKAHVFSCGPGHSYNPKLACIPDDQYKCPYATEAPITNGTTTELPSSNGITTDKPSTTELPNVEPKYYDYLCTMQNKTTVPHPTNCYLYIECDYGASTLRACDVGELYHPDYFCVSDEKYKCPIWDNGNGTSEEPITEDEHNMTTETTTIGTTENYDFLCNVSSSTVISHPADCGLYILCIGKRAILLSCGPKLVFDPVETTCVTQDKYNCTESTISTTHLPTTENESSFICQSKSEISIMKHSYNCQMFIICENGVGKTYQCKNNTVFSWENLACVPETRWNCESYFEDRKPEVSTPWEAHFCWNHSTDLIENPLNCTQYINCSRKQPKNFDCPPNTVFNIDYQDCLPGNTLTCTLKSLGFSDYCLGKYFGKAPHPYLCNRYANCYPGFATYASCNEKYIFNSNSGRCVPGNYRHCSSLLPESYMPA